MIRWIPFNTLPPTISAAKQKKTSSRVSPRVVLPTNLWKHLTARLGQTQCGVGLGRSWISRNEQRKRPGRILSMKCWLFIRDPYGGLLFPHNWAVQSCNMYHPLYTRKNQGPFFKCSLVGACFQGDTSSSPPCYLFSKGLKHKPYHLWYLSFLYLYIYIPGTLNNHICQWMLGETTIFDLKSWNHPIETTIYKWMFQVPGTHRILFRRTAIKFTYMNGWFSWKQCR